MTVLSEIGMMIDELDRLNVPVSRFGRCMTVSKNHHDFKTNRDSWWYLTGVLEQARIRAVVSRKEASDDNDESY